jgi:hypothetical protein
MRPNKICPTALRLMRSTRNGSQQGPESQTLQRAKPFKLYEFFAQDIDGNYFRVFYDFAWEEKRDARL